MYLNRFTFFPFFLFTKRKLLCNAVGVWPFFYFLFSSISSCFFFARHCWPKKVYYFPSYVYLCNKNLGGVQCSRSPSPWDCCEGMQKYEKSFFFLFFFGLGLGYMPRKRGLFSIVKCTASIFMHFDRTFQISVSVCAQNGS